jgi:hypothetical protein
MNVDNAIRQAIITKLGSLLLANMELAAHGATLATAVKQRDATIADLQAQLDNATKQLAGLSENLPADRYSGEHKGPLQ